MISQAKASDDLSSFAFNQRLGQQVPVDTAFTDAHGRGLTLRQAIGGRPTILALGYFNCPNLCGFVRADLMNALAHLTQSVPYSLLVLSIDPAETASAAASAEAADMAQTDVPHRDYLTGSATAVQALEQAVGLRARFDEATKQFLHPAGLVVLTASGTVSGYLLGVGYQPGDVSLALAQAANGVTAKAMPVLLLCFHFDPATGRYTLAIERLLNIACFLTVVVVGGTIYLALKRERRPR